MATDLDNAGSVGLRFGGVDSSTHSWQIVRIAHGLDVPVVGRVAGRHILCEGESGASVDGDVVIVVKHNELSCRHTKRVTTLVNQSINESMTPLAGEPRGLTQAQMTSQRGGLGRHALLQTAVSANHVSEVVDNGETVLLC